MAMLALQSNTKPVWKEECSALLKLMCPLALEKMALLTHV